MGSDFSCGFRVGFRGGFREEGNRGGVKYTLYE